jgi:hypothetical protein
MAKIVQKNFDKKVQLIADRDAISDKIIGTVVLVNNAIDDVDVGVSAAARYMWDGITWKLVQKDSIDITSFASAELHTIPESGIVMLDNVPVDAAIWDVSICDPVSGDVLYGIDVSKITIEGATVSGLDDTDFVGNHFKCSYAYGNVTTQMSILLESKYDKADTYSKSEIDDMISNVESSVEGDISGLIGTINEFEGALV